MSKGGLPEGCGVWSKASRKRPGHGLVGRLSPPHPARLLQPQCPVFLLHPHTCPALVRWKLCLLQDRDTQAVLAHLRKPCLRFWRRISPRLLFQLLWICWVSGCSRLSAWCSRAFGGWFDGKAVSLLGFVLIFFFFARAQSGGCVGVSPLCLEGPPCLTPPD